MAPGSGVRKQRVRHHEIQRACKFLFRTREILAAKQHDTAIKMGLATRQILRRGKRRSAGHIVVRQRRVLLPGEFLGTCPQE
jgi:hypothetical protein